ncbi:response regulator transcription factor [Xanthomonadaceae bacterium JHOS43]|nr:response regulator transcription factor [Xanthomonadaceae bacterium JHOS43]MCX7563048.1 response regulator transcription factor [Xanthomonadaceae bacterium XH05]
MPVLLIADDHPLFRAALTQAALAAAPDCEVLEAADLATALATLESDPRVDLVLLDLHMPGNHGLAGLAALRAQFPAVAVVVCSGNDDPRVVRRALDHGAAGFIPKRTSMDDIRRAIAAMLACDTWLPDDLRATLVHTASDPVDADLAVRLSRLTAQQFRVLALIAEGLLNKQIADRLDVQERTVKAHVTAIFEKLGVRNRTQASLLLRELSLSAPDTLADSGSMEDPTA